MPVATVAPDSKAGQASAGDVQRLVPFVRAAHRHFEPIFDVSQAPGASAVQLGPFDVKSYGFIRSIVLLVEVSGGTLGAGALNADAPFSIIQSAELIDTNGYPLINPLTGYQLFLANLLGAYAGFPDPRSHPNYDATINASFQLRLPVEITAWDGFGSLQNQSASAPFRVRMSLAPIASYVTGATTNPTAVRIRGYLEAWSQPMGVDLNGQPTETAPPGHGAAQYWSVTTPTVSAARQQIRLTRTGNLIRALAFVHRDVSGVRSATVEPDDITFTWDTRQILVAVPNKVHRGWQREAFGFDFPTGVLVLPFNDDQDGTAGNESRHLYLPSVGSTRFEYEGTFGAAGTVEILTNDVAVTQLGR